jgi:hypothetical protein
MAWNYVPTVYKARQTFEGGIRGVARQESLESGDYRELVVDPVLGNDDNDGYMAPIKTLYELFQRLAARTFMKGNYYANQPFVRLKAGTHDFVAGMIPDPYNYIIMTTGNAQIFGEWSAPLASFLLDSVAGDTTRWSKPAGDASWTVDEWAGKWIRIPATYPPPVGAPPEWFFEYYPILSNTTHELTLGSVFSPIGWYPVPALGSTIEIVEMTSIVTSSDSWGGFFQGQGAQGYGLTWQNIKFQMTVPSAYTVLYCTDATMNFMTCHFLGNGGGLISVTGNSTVLIRGPSLWQNCFGGLGLSDTTYAHLWESAYLNCTQHIGASGPCHLDIWAHYHMRNCSTLFFSGGGVSTFVDGMFAIACRGVWELYDASNGAQIWLGAPTILDNAKPGVWVYTYGPGITTVNGNRAEAATGSLVHGYDMGWTGLSIADLKTVHKGEWFGSAGVEFRLSTPWWT